MYLSFSSILIRATVGSSGIRGGGVGHGLTFHFIVLFRSCIVWSPGIRGGAGTVNFSPPSVHQSKTAHSSTSSYTSKIVMPMMTELYNDNGHDDGWIGK